MKRDVILILTFILTCNLAFSWNLKGHQTVARIAEMNVKPRTLERINKILNGETMVSIAGWADDDIRTARKETDHWHGTALSVKNDITPENIKSFYPDKKDTLIYQLKKEIAELKDPLISAGLKNEDLKFLIHFTGDLHMPMHCASNGGKNIIDTEANLKKEKPATLHSVWDSLLPIKDVNEYAADLDKSITAEQKRAWAANDPDSWVYESFIISKNIIFKDIPFGAQTVTLPEDYKKTMAPIGIERIEKAGIRLAMLLDEIFK